MSDTVIPLFPSICWYLSSFIDLYAYVQNVRGELYLINDAMLAHMDSLEGCPRYYERMPLRVRLVTPASESLKVAGSMQAGDLVDCEVYFFTDTKPDVVAGQHHWVNFDASEAQYDPRENRDATDIESALAEMKFLTKPLAEIGTSFKAPE